MKKIKSWITKCREEWNKAIGPSLSISIDENGNCTIKNTGSVKINVTHHVKIKFSSGSSGGGHYLRPGEQFGFSTRCIGGQSECITVKELTDYLSKKSPDSLLIGEAYKDNWTPGHPLVHGRICVGDVHGTDNMTCLEVRPKQVTASTKPVLFHCQ